MQIQNQSGHDIILGILKQHTRLYKVITCHKMIDENILVGELLE